LHFIQYFFSVFEKKRTQLEVIEILKFDLKKNSLNCQSKSSSKEKLKKQERN